MTNKFKLMIAAVGLSATAVAGVMLGVGAPHMLAAGPVVTTTYYFERPLMAGYGYNSTSKRFEAMAEETVCRFDWKDSNEKEFTIKIDDQYLGTSGDDLVLSASEVAWRPMKFETSVVLTTSPITKMPTSGLLLSNNNYNYIKHYGLTHLADETPYTIIQPFNDLTSWLGKGCEDIKGTFAKDCLTTLITGLEYTPEEDDTLKYELIPVTGSNSGYAGNCDVEIGSITWNVEGNTTMLPWRLGGKNISNQTRAVTSKTVITDSINKVIVELGTMSGITVNSSQLLVSTNKNFSDAVSYNFTSAVNSKIEIDITAVSNAYFKFSFNLSVSGGSNKFIQFTGASFYNI